jgi:hypothetical protein
VAHAYNPSYSGSKDREDQGLTPAWANNLQDLILKKPITKKASGVAQGVGPEFKPQYYKYIYIYTYIYTHIYMVIPKLRKVRELIKRHFDSN